jgi:hypothetical protein
VVGVTIWITLKTAVSANLVPAQPEEIVEMFEKVKAGQRVYDAVGRDVSAEVVETVVDWHMYDAKNIYFANKVCQFFDKLKEDTTAENIILAATIARLYDLNVDKYTILKAIWNKDPSLIPVPPKCLK